MSDKINNNGVISTNNNLKKGISTGLKDKSKNVYTLEDAKRNKDLTYKQINYVGSHGLNFFSLILVILISVSLIRILKGGAGDIVSFGSLLDLLKDAPQISSDVLFFTEQLEIVADWGILNGLRDFINSIVDFWSILVWCGSSLVDLFIYIFYFLKWIFI